MPSVSAWYWVTLATAGDKAHLPHAIVVRLHVRIFNIVILILETVDTVRIWAVAYPFR